MHSLISNNNRQLAASGIKNNLSITILLLFTLSPVFASNVKTGKDESAHLPYWEWNSKAKTIRLVQRLPDQSRAYFMARGFNRSNAEIIAQSCVFQTIYRNSSSPDAPHIITYDLSKWYVVSQGKQKPLKTREDWLQEWKKKKINPAALIAFEWSLIPTRQQYQATDYNWGMSVFNLPPGEHFDLHMLWTVDGEQQTGIIPNMQCAPDIHMDPPAE